MPQLDRFAFVSQVIWLIVVFLSLYFVILKTGLPRLYKVLLYRDKKLETLKEGSESLTEEEGELNIKTREMVLGFLKEMKGSPEQVVKLLDKDLEDRKGVLRTEFEGLKDKGNASVEKEVEERLRRVGGLLEATDFVKDKLTIKKRIIN